MLSNSYNKVTIFDNIFSFHIHFEQKHISQFPAKGIKYNINVYTNYLLRYLVVIPVENIQLEIPPGIPGGFSRDSVRISSRF